MPALRFLTGDPLYSLLTTMPPPRELYEKRVSITLGGFQITEQFLKEYIALAYEVMRKLLDGTVEFSSSRKDIENHSLERLISTFKTLNGNRELIKNLQGVVEHRNKLAHRALLPLYGAKPTDEEYLKLIDEISPLQGEIDNCLVGVRQELLDLARQADVILSNGEKRG